MVAKDSIEARGSSGERAKEYTTLLFAKLCLALFTHYHTAPTHCLLLCCPLVSCIQTLKIKNVPFKPLKISSILDKIWVLCDTLFKNLDNRKFFPGIPSTVMAMTEFYLDVYAVPVQFAEASCVDGYIAVNRAVIESVKALFYVIILTRIAGLSLICMCSLHPGKFLD